MRYRLFIGLAYIMWGLMMLWMIILVPPAIVVEEMLLKIRGPFTKLFAHCALWHFGAIIWCMKRTGEDEEEKEDVNKIVDSWEENNRQLFDALKILIGE
jgi:hypothetical protein